MTDTFDPTRPCKRKNGKKIVQLVKLERPIHGSEEEWMALDDGGDVSFNYNDGRVYTVSSDSRDIINIPEEVEVVRWAVFDRATGDYMMRSYHSEQQAIENAKNSQVVVRLTGSYTR